MATASHVGTHGEGEKVQSTESYRMSHTPEPWVLGTGDFSGRGLHGSDGNGNVLGLQRSPEERNANRQRILACVNGCAGLNPSAYWECVEALKALDGETEVDCKPTAVKSAQSDAWVRTPFGRAKSMAKNALAHAQGQR